MATQDMSHTTLTLEQQSRTAQPAADQTGTDKTTDSHHQPEVEEMKK